MKKVERYLLPLLFVLSIFSIIIGFFLQTILFPIADFHLMSDAEILKAQQEYALNYPLGTLLLEKGCFLFLGTIAFWIYKKYTNKKATA
jgi:signal transduction histidine kinase